MYLDGKRKERVSVVWACTALGAQECLSVERTRAGGDTFLEVVSLMIRFSKVQWLMVSRAFTYIGSQRIITTIL